MTFKDLRKFLDNNSSTKSPKNNLEEQQQEIKLNSQRFAIFRDKPFWISDLTQHKRADIANKGLCCFNHIIGLPTKDGIEKPIFDYEMQLGNALDNNKNIFIKKSRGLGITEILLRYMSWLAVRNNDYSGCRFHIVTGPRINLAENLIDRLHGLFMNKLGIDCKQVGPIIYVNNTIIQAFPSHTSYSMRGYTNVKFIFIDEAAYFPPGQQDEVRAVCEAYRPKSNPFVVIVSTPYKPGDFFESIDRDQNSIFKKLNFHYSVGLNKIYNPQEIEKEKNQPYFKREFELFYAVGTGNVFIEETLQRAEELGKQYRDISYNTTTQKALGIDPGFGSSKTAFTVIELVDGIIHVLYSKQFAKSSTDQMVMHAKDLMAQYGILGNDESNKVFIDGSASGFIRSLKYQTHENPHYEQVIQKARQDGLDDQLHLYMNIVPVNFSTKGKSMLDNLKKYIDMGKLAIDPEAHKELLTELRIATANEDMTLEKDQTNTMDLLDSLRLACVFIK
jgi:hypothetical protein